MEDKLSITLWNSLRATSKKTESNMDSLKRKQTGSYYTDLDLTDAMMKELVDVLDTTSKKIFDYTFFEPCVGSGNFVFSYLKAVMPMLSSKEEAYTLLNNIYVSDINRDAIQQYKKSLSGISLDCWGICLSDEYFETHIGTGLLLDVTSEELEYIPLESAFHGFCAEKKFDIIATNPPYKNLKAERTHYVTDVEYEQDKQKYSAISKIVSSNFVYAVDGVLNLYKLFVEEIIDKYANEAAHISLLIPSSILSDKTCAKLRTHILSDMSLLSVRNIPEGSGYIDAQQALCTILISKKKIQDFVNITKDYCANPEECADVKIKDILNKYTENAIYAVSGNEYEILKKLRSFPVVKELEFITNSRGELDLTAGKKYISCELTNNCLLRGRNIGLYSLLKPESSDYVLDEFLATTQKNKYITSDRIACQQIANMNKERRVTFAYVPAGYVLGNSCNFIAVGENEYDIDIYALLGLFNCSCVNWLFKLTSSNNHVNNYEIDSFPVPIQSKVLKKISVKVKEYLLSGDETLIDEIEQLSMEAYGLTESKTLQVKTDEVILQFYEDILKVIPLITQEVAMKVLSCEEDINAYFDGLSEFERKVAKGITDKYISLSRNHILNHNTFKLSELDLEMIKNVPQGGSWKDIPPETVEKSKRLKRISETGGRTTLYGRIDYEKPSYTITTYFNRPGNGTYVHPIHERVISVREAARFQTFTDDYYFCGNKTQLLKQVGNAVPTLLAYQIGDKIRKKTGCSTSIDLFCGAGGMTAGFKAAGICSQLSNDIEESACVTLKVNNPEINVLCGDITKDETKSEIAKVSADIICGGPPCQGFSMAGFRAEDDPRNQLFRDFVDIVKRVNPKIIVFENVEGILSYQGGKTYQEVHKLFSELGYNTAGRTLMANEYAVPQKRKRVIIICTRVDVNVKPEELYPDALTADEINQVTAYETIGDLEKVDCSEMAQYNYEVNSDIIEFFKNNISYEEYIRRISDKVNAQLGGYRIVEEHYEQLTLQLE